MDFSVPLQVGDRILLAGMARNSDKRDEAVWRLVELKDGLTPRAVASGTSKLEDAKGALNGWANKDANGNIFLTARSGEYVHVIKLGVAGEVVWEKDLTWNNTYFVPMGERMASSTMVEKNLLDKALAKEPWKNGQNYNGPGQMVQLSLDNDGTEHRRSLIPEEEGMEWDYNTYIGRDDCGCILYTSKNKAYKDVTRVNVTE